MYNKIVSNTFVLNVLRIVQILLK